MLTAHSFLTLLWYELYELSDLKFTDEQRDEVINRWLIRNLYCLANTSLDLKLNIEAELRAIWNIWSNGLYEVALQKLTALAYSYKETVNGIDSPNILLRNNETLALEFNYEWILKNE